MRTRAFIPSLVIGAGILTTVAAAAAEFERAQWIAPPAGVATNGACPMFRKEFVLDRQPRRAWLRIVGLGDFDARVNGRRLAETAVQTPRGRVASRWSKDGITFHLDVEVPKGVKATAILPSGARKTLRSGNQAIQETLPNPAN